MIKQLIKEGFILKSKGYYKHAIEAFYKALELDNKSPELLLEIAELYFLMGKEEHALSYIKQILDTNPVHIGSLELLEKIFLEKGALEDAEQTAKNIYCISHKTKDFERIFEILIQEEKYSEIFTYNTEENSPKITYFSALAKYRLNEFEEAESLINKALNAEKNQDFLLLKGQILLKENKDDECKNLLNEIKIDENNPELLNFAGLVEQRFGNYRKALEYFQTALKLEPQNDEYNYNCASTYFKMGENTLARKFYNMAISINPENNSYHLALANLYYSEKLYKRAMEELYGDFYEARLLKSIILYDTGYLALAKKELHELEKICPKDNIVTDYIEKIRTELSIN